MSTSAIKHRTLTGVVVSAKMTKTVVVRVDRLKKHPKYGKQYGVSRKFKAHNEDPSVQEGDAIVIEETRPLSREKRWRVIKKLSTGRKVEFESAENLGAITEASGDPE